MKPFFQGIKNLPYQQNLWKKNSVVKDFYGWWKIMFGAKLFSSVKQSFCCFVRMRILGNKLEKYIKLIPTNPSQLIKFTNYRIHLLPKESKSWITPIKIKINCTKVKKWDQEAMPSVGLQSNHRQVRKSEDCREKMKMQMGSNLGWAQVIEEENGLWSQLGSTPCASGKDVTQMLGYVSIRLQVEWGFYLYCIKEWAGLLERHKEKQRGTQIAWERERKDATNVFGLPRLVLGLWNRLHLWS